MPGITGVLNIGKGALLAQQKAMEVTGHNIANVNTLGYSRQTVIFEAVAPFTQTRIKTGLGVNIDSVRQNVDQFVNRSLYEKISSNSGQEAMTSVLSYVENIFNEASGEGLSQAMNEFWNAWQDVSTHSGGTAERTALLGKAENLCTAFNSMSADLTQTGKNLTLQVASTLDELNKISKNIAQINDQIVAAEASGTRANDLRDQRGSLVEALSELIGQVSLEDESGSLTVMTSDGLTLVNGNSSWELRQHGDNIYWNDIEQDVSERLTGGKIGAWLDIRDEVLPQFSANLDELAGTVINEVNTIHFAGYTLTNETGKYFFENFLTDPSIPNSDDYSGAAAYIRLSSDVENDPDQIAAGGESDAPGDNENALKILSLQTDDTVEITKWSYKERGENVSSTIETQTMDDYYRILTGEIGILTQDATQSQKFEQTMVDRLQELQDSVSGVNLDEELTEMLQLQRGYEAAAKLVSVADQMLESLMQIR